MTYSMEQIKARLETLPHPQQKDALLTVDKLEINQDKLVVSFGFPRGTGQAFSIFQRRVLQLLKQELAIPKVQLLYSEAVIPETVSRMRSLYPNALFLAVLSGKGGVGKSTITYKLAEAFTHLGKRTAIIDADIYGASIPQIMQIPKTAPVAIGTKLQPYLKDGIAVMSSSLIMQDDLPVMWKGPMLTRLLQQFLFDVAWADDTDVFLFDMPPGTGDILFTLNELVPETQALVITTPQVDAAYVATKAGNALQELTIEAIGVIENMAYLEVAETNEVEYVFGKDGGAYVSEALAIPLLAHIPLQTPLPFTLLLDVAQKMLSCCA